MPFFGQTNPPDRRNRIDFDRSDRKTLAQSLQEGLLASPDGEECGALIGFWQLAKIFELGDAKRARRDLGPAVRHPLDVHTDVASLDEGKGRAPIGPGQAEAKTGFAGALNQMRLAGEALREANLFGLDLEIEA